MSTRRYVFWRDGAGRPYRKPDDKHAASNLLAKIGNDAKLADNGGISWNGMFAQKCLTAIEQMIAIVGPVDCDLNAIDAHGIINSAVNEAIRKIGGSRPIPTQLFIDEADKKAADFYRRTPQQYVLLSGVSIAKCPVKRISIDNHAIKFVAGYGRKYSFPKSLSSQKTPFGHWPLNTGYTRIEITTEGRSVVEAVDNAMSVLGVLCGIWALVTAYRQYSIHVPKPIRMAIGSLHIGPVHTLHHLDGNPATELYWYEPHYVTNQKVYTPSGGWGKAEADRKIILKKIRKLAYRQELEELLRRYAAALDNSDVNVAFLQLWSLLEKITGTIGTNYDQTINRATWGYDDRGLWKEFLGGIRTRRNQFVHAATSENSEYGLAYLLKEFVDVHLVRLIRNDFKVQSLQEYAERLEISMEPSKLRRQVKDLRRALALLEPAKPSKERETT